VARRNGGARRTDRSENRIEWEILARILKELRLATPISARQLSLKLGKDAAFIHKVENGIQQPGFVAVLDIATILGVDPHDILSRVINESQIESQHPKN
jgi:transcriptional regulator with XRE-family HTH domain